MPDELTPEEHDILSNSPADSPVRVGGDSEKPTSGTGAASTEDENLPPGAQTRQPSEGGRVEAEG